MYSAQVPTGTVQQVSQNSVAPLALPRLSIPGTPAPSIHSGGNNNNIGNGSNNSNGINHLQHHSSEKSKAAMSLSPLANGVTVTNQSQPNLGDMLSRQTMQTKYVTRPQTPVTASKTFAMTPTPHLGHPGHQSFPQFQCQTMTLPGRGNRSSARTNANQRHSTMTDDGKFTVQPAPTIAYPENNTATWQASLPRLVRHLPANAQVSFISSSLAWVAYL